MDFVKKGRIKLSNISKAEALAEDGKLIIKERPAIEGLAIDYKYDPEKDSYIVIAFVKYNEDKETYLELVGTRLLQLNKDEFEDFKQVADIGMSIVECLNDEAED